MAYSKRPCSRCLFGCKGASQTQRKESFGVKIMHSNRRCILRVLLAALVLQLCLCDDYTKKPVGKSYQGDCKYHGYVPGGGVPDISPIPSPVCEAFTSLVGYAFGVTGHTKKTAAAVSNVAGQKVAEKLKSMEAVSRKMLTAMHRADKILRVASQSTAVFGAAFGLVSAVTSPTPNEILARVNKAFEELTKETNIRFAKMKEYVDAKVLKLEREAVKRHFDTLQLKMKNCMTHTSDQGILTCQKQTVESFNTEAYHFLRLLNKYSANRNIWHKGVDSLGDVKYLEAILITFRDYASEHLIELKDLIDIYRANATIAATKKNEIIRNLCIIKNRGEFYHDYANWAYLQISRTHILENLGSGGGPKTDFKKSGIKTIWTSIWTWNIAQKGIEIRPNCPGMTESAKQSCVMRHFQPMTNPRSIAVPGYPMAKEASDRKNSETVRQIKRNADKEATDHCKSIFKRFKKDVETYWKKELLLPAKIWQTASEVARKDLRSLNALSKCHSPLIPDVPSHNDSAQEDLPHGDSPQGEEPHGLDSPSDESAQGDSPQGDSSNGELPQGGLDHGDSLQGGPNNGDSLQGGPNNGDSPQGGSDRGDSPQGGSDRGDSPQGGSDHGDSPQGGSNNGGTSQGGSDHGGTSQGGLDYGGTPQGGSDNGGTPQSVSDHGSTPQGGIDHGDTPQGGSGDSSIGGV